MTVPTPMLASQRKLFEIPDEVAYLNCAYMGPQLKSVTDAGHRASLRKETPWQIAASDFFADGERLRTLFAQLIGAGGEDIALVPSASYGIGVAAANLPVGRNDRIVILDEQFPSNVYPWRALAQARNATVATVARPADGDWTAAVVAEIARGAAVVALPQVHWTDGTVVDLVAVGSACREAGAALVLDLTQSLGAAPFDIEAIRPDFMVAAGYKWLLGPYSLGYLYVSPRWQQGRPLEYNWIARERSEDFAGLVSYRDGYQPGARRFDVGERSNFVLVPMAIAALEQILAWSVPAIGATTGAMTARIAESATAMGLAVAPASQRSAHMLGLRFAGGIPDGLAQQLAAANVHVSLRGASVRVAPHVYNTARDIDSLLEALSAFAPRRSGRVAAGGAD